jgi:HK97 gp10 family phage protein
MNVQFTDNSKEVLEAMQQAAVRALEKCGLTAEGYAKKEVPVDTGNLRNSITHRVDEAEPSVFIGTNNEYAAYVELGTGKYTTGGRPDPWVYQDDKGRWHHTNGQRARPYLKPAVADHKEIYRGIIDNELKNG